MAIICKLLLIYNNYLNADGISFNMLHLSHWRKGIALLMSRDILMLYMALAGNTATLLSEIYTLIFNEIFILLSAGLYL